MRKIFTLLIVAILATATSWAAEKTILLQNKTLARVRARLQRHL